MVCTYINVTKTSNLKEVVIKKFGFISLSLFLLTACQSTENKVVEAKSPIKIKAYTPELVEDTILKDLPIPTVPIIEQELSEATLPYKKDDKIIYKQKSNETSFINKQVCKDNIKVTYSVSDPNGVSGTYHAELQAQAIIISVSQTNIKLRTTGWYSKSINLNKWAPYLKKPPIAKGILLAVDDEFWDNNDDWYLCGGVGM
jgi:hypothetical protein